ncbi:MAG TPA: hypothetical protein VNJ52_00730 [Patescibacteria group bacterium]|nr:hypothetical protein [Patescibacteria group bacterium]
MRANPSLFSTAQSAPFVPETGRPRHPRERLLYGLVIFSSAFLLFLVQLLIAKIILPWFSGVAEVWAVCLVFFQSVLLLGYLYAHWLTRNFRPRVQGRIHAALLAASILWLPILPKASWQPSGREDPAAYILWLLALTIGLPFFLLSSTSPLLQAWYAGSRGTSPYRFYALSNAGSLLALLVFPILVEPEISSSHQAIGWSAAYAGLVLLCGATGLALGRRNRPPSPRARPARRRTQSANCSGFRSPPAGRLCFWRLPTTSRRKSPRSRFSGCSPSGFTC